MKILSLSLALVLSAGAFSSNAHAQLAMEWHTMDAGGGTSSGATLSISGTIGQLDASGPSAVGTTNAIDAGFWPGFTLVPPCPADFDGDGTVDFFDYDAFVLCFEGFACPPGRDADFDGDGAFDFFDYDAFVQAFEKGC
ncbi:MAG: hypothetical protein AABZ53_00025 [Planctomycetota bacterium]